MWRNPPPALAVTRLRVLLRRYAPYREARSGHPSGTSPHKARLCFATQEIIRAKPPKQYNYSSALEQLLV
jgi:hypothetical protein